MRTTLYLAKTDSLLEKDVFGKLYAGLPESRRKRADKYALKADKNNSAAASALLLRALTEAYPDRDISGESVAVSEGPNGKPYLPDFPEFYFSLSHSGNLAVCLVSDSECGVDIEVLREEPRGVAARFFAREEINYIASFSEAERGNAFFKIWTMKESFVKACGHGIAMGLDSFSVVRRVKTVRTLRGQYSFYAFQFENFEVSCCVKSNKKMNPKLNVVDFKHI